MKFIVTKDYEEMSKAGADIIIEQIKSKSSSVLGLATGGTPVGMYKHLVEAYNKGLDFSKIVTFNLDEYVGLKPDNPQSYRYYMDKNLFNNVNINKDNIHIPSGISSDIDKECEEYDESISKMGGIDLQVLGIGRNGHIGFNEPGDTLKVKTHVAKLSQNTIKANSRFFDKIEDVPTSALTMGLGSIMKSKKILLLASGLSKAQAIAKIAEPIIDLKVPASLLQLHPNVVVILDKDAASMLNLK
jgi:glucosamine-6-phosphate deaminase